MQLSSFPRSRCAVWAALAFVLLVGPRSNAQSEFATVYSGRLEKLAAGAIVVELADGRYLEIRVSKQTRYVKDGRGTRFSSLQPGDDLRIEAREDEDGFLHADRVAVVIGDGSVPDKLPGLKRRVAAVFDGDSIVDSFIEKARREATRFARDLPNYICSQSTTRFESETYKSWRTLDVVSADVIYEKGQERYRNIQLNGQPAKAQGMEQVTGSWSKGEFGTILRHLFASDTAAEFKFVKDLELGGRSARLYDFSVARHRSRWQVRMPSQYVLTAYKGSVWLDEETARPLRIEMEAIGLPHEFPLDKVEMMVEYSFVPIGSEQHLLPTQSENLACWRTKRHCVRNRIEFGDYRKFTSESQLVGITEEP